MTPIEKFFAILALLLMVAWLFTYWLDEELARRKELHLWPYN